MPCGPSELVITWKSPPPKRSQVEQPLRQHSLHSVLTQDKTLAWLRTMNRHVSKWWWHRYWKDTLVSHSLSVGLLFCDGYFIMKNSADLSCGPAEAFHCGQRTCLGIWGLGIPSEDFSLFLLASQSNLELRKKNPRRTEQPSADFPTLLELINSTAS